MPPGPPRILVAGIGNIFLGDDAFGSEVARNLLRRSFPENVRIVDFGIRGLDLVYALLEGWDAAILIDAVPRPGEPPGTLYVLEPRLDDAQDATPPSIQMHSMDPMTVLLTAKSMGARMPMLRVVGCQPSPQAEDDDGSETLMGLSDAVAASIDEATKIVESLIALLSASVAQEPLTPPQEVLQ
jgi:hydrogenase maturation protease